MANKANRVLALRRSVGVWLSLACLLVVAPALAQENDAAAAPPFAAGDVLTFDETGATTVYASY